MFNSSILDVALGVALVFLLVSTVCAAVREGIESYLKTRASYLEYAIRELLNDRAGVGLAKHFFEHPMISGLYQGDYVSGSRDKAEPGNERPRWWHRGGDMPSYIPAKSFSAALIDLAARGPSTDAASADPDLTEVTFESLRQSVLNLQNPKVQRALLAALDTSRRDLDVARKNLEAWYDGAMDRVSGWYKRSTQTIIFLVALVVVGAVNVNTITIADHLYRDQSLREAVVGSAAGVHKDLSYADASSRFEEMRLPVGWSGGEAGWGSPRTRGERVELENARRSKLYEAALAKSPQGNVPPLVLIKLEQLPRDLWYDVLAPVLGLLATAFAAMLGAPFWFDVLNKVMVIRATVKPHEKSREEGSEDRQDRQPAQLRLAPSVPVASAVESAVHAPLAQGFPSPVPDNDTTHELDACDEPITDATLDADLPVARGGVG